MNNQLLRFRTAPLDPRDISDIASRICRSLEISNRLFGPYCSPSFASIVLQVAMTVHSGSRATIKSIAAQKGLSPSTVSRMVLRLVSDGLLTAADDLEDRRRTVVGLTVTSESLAAMYFENLHRIFYGDGQTGHRDGATYCDRRPASLE